MRQIQALARIGALASLGLMVWLFLANSAIAEEQFLEPEELELLQPSAGIEGLMRYQVGDQSPADFDRILIGGVTFFLQKTARARTSMRMNSRQSPMP